MRVNKKARAIEFLRLGNPWMVGENVNRIVPVYVLHNLINRAFLPTKGLQSIKDLTQDPAHAKANGLEVSFRDATDQEVKNLAYGLLAPERRVFGNKSGGASETGAVFPLLGGMAESQAGDDGLGRRLRALLDSVDPTWRLHISRFMAPEEAKDPATAFGFSLLGGQAGNVRSAELDLKSEEQVASLDRELAAFVLKLIPQIDDARRILAIRDLALGAYLVSVLRMVLGPLQARSPESKVVFVYAGLPPGDSNDPLVQGASSSMASWVERSWSATADTIAATVESTHAVSGLPQAERRRQQVQLLLKETVQPTDRVPNDTAIEALLDSISSTFDEVDSRSWSRTVLSSDAIRLSSPALLLRVRNLAKTIGFAAPDRGVGEPRLVLDTPLLAVLVKGLLPSGSTSMDYRQFVSDMAWKLGLVVGIGNDDRFAEHLDFAGSNGLDVYEILEANEEILRTRLLRVGLARTYSDSHTEVVFNGK